MRGDTLTPMDRRLIITAVPAGQKPRTDRVEDGMSQVWELTKAAWSMAGRPIPAAMDRSIIVASGRAPC